nr:hypothetical protein [Mycoplasmopsis bovis]
MDYHPSSYSLIIFNFNSSISTGSDLHWRWNYHPVMLYGLVIILESLLIIKGFKFLFFCCKVIGTAIAKLTRAKLCQLLMKIGNM